MNPTLLDIVDLITKTGAIGMLVLIIWAGMTEKWVWGWQHRQDLKDRDIELDKVRADKDKEIYRLEQEKDELWLLLKQATGLLFENTTVANKAVTLASRTPQHKDTQ
jgi:hypothetical protein